MRVLIIFNHPAPYKVKVFNELSKYCDLTVLFERTKAKDRPDSFYYENNIQFKHLFLKDGYVGKEGSISNKVRRYIKNHHSDFDLIIMNGYSHLAEIKAIKYMSKHNIKFGLLINGGLVKKESSLKKWYKTRLISKASYYLSPSKASNEYLKYYGAPENRIFNYPYSNFSTDEILKEPIKDKDALRDEFTLPKGKKIFINASQFINRKNNLELISLFKKKADILLLVGEGPELNKYQNYIKENKMDNVIIKEFLKKDKLFSLFKCCNYYITLSKEDIFGHTTLEALANGLPVISSKNVMSSVEYIKDGYNGYLVDINNKEEIIDKLNKINDSLSINAIESVKNNTFESSAKTIYKILEEVYDE